MKLTDVLVEFFTMWHTVLVLVFISYSYKPIIAKMITLELHCSIRGIIFPCIALSTRHQKMFQLTL